VTATPLLPVTDPAPLVALYGRHPEVHPYGLADVDEPYWSRSTWYRDGDAAVGVLDLGSGTPVLYAIAADAALDAATLDLLDRLRPVLPDHFVVTGPVGLAERLAPAWRADWVIPHTKMALVDPDRLDPVDERVEWLDRAHVDQIVDLRARGGGDASAFFVPELVDSGLYCGIRSAGELVAVAGVHVCSEQHRVAALGNVLTRPDHRRRGLARALVSTLGRRLLGLVGTIGLNVAVTNTGACALYEDLGFAPLVTYDEAELAR
jgi:ribosomal protein S18 acetylase RimI-like enzyme